MNEDKLTLYFLAILITGAVVWAYFTPIDISIEARATVRPDGGTIHVSSQTSGRIAHVHGREGEEVRGGDVLLQLDTRDADLKQRILENRIHAAEIQMQKLRDSISLTPFSTRIEILHQELVSLYQQLEQAELDRGRLTIVSPADGVISSVAGLRAGEIIGEGANVATIIPSDRGLILESWLPVRERARLHEGQTVQVQPDDLTQVASASFEGTVMSVSPDVQTLDSTTMYRVVVAPVGNSRHLRNGMKCRIRFITQYERMLTVLFDRLRGKPGSRTPAFCSITVC